MKDVQGLEGLYAVSEDGRVWSYPKRILLANGGYHLFGGRFLNAFKRGTRGKQYLAVELRGKIRTIHRLVAEAFIPNPDNLPQINHKDLNRFNNCVANLEWSTQLLNSQHAEKNGAMKRFYGEQHRGHKLTSKQVVEIREKKSRGATLKQLATEYNGSISNMSYITRMETRSRG